MKMYLQQTLQLLALQVVENALYIHYYPLHLFQYHKEGLVLNRQYQYYECLYCKHIKYLIITNKCERYSCVVIRHPDKNQLFKMSDNLSDFII